MTESCLDALEIDREAQSQPQRSKVTKLRTAGELADCAL
jgi:hypothetical protein